MCPCSIQPFSKSSGVLANQDNSLFISTADRRAIKDYKQLIIAKFENPFICMIWETTVKLKTAFFSRSKICLRTAQTRFKIKHCIKPANIIFSDLQYGIQNITRLFRVLFSGGYNLHSYTSPFLKYDMTNLKCLINTFGGLTSQKL